MFDDRFDDEWFHLAPCLIELLLHACSSSGLGFDAHASVRLCMCPTVPLGQTISLWPQNIFDTKTTCSQTKGSPKQKHELK